eukprot:9472810-Pyramimonas_sp.AAC.1
MTTKLAACDAHCTTTKRYRTRKSPHRACSWQKRSSRLAAFWFALIPSPVSRWTKRKQDQDSTVCSFRSPSTPETTSTMHFANTAPVLRPSGCSSVGKSKHAPGKTTVTQLPCTLGRAKWGPTTRNPSPIEICGGQAFEGANLCRNAVGSPWPSTSGLGQGGPARKRRSS